MKPKRYSQNKFLELTGYSRPHLWILRYGSKDHATKPIFSEGADFFYERGRLFYTENALKK
ncbi:MAG: hypothetical protein KGN01_08155, partial [Patescibacteria group bacterium]|nr:hypothetical protein [Patescibacteria group bacterium]